MEHFSEGGADDDQRTVGLDVTEVNPMAKSLDLLEKTRLSNS